MSKAHNKLAGDKTHALQQDIIAGRVNTKNGGAEFDAEADLKMPPEEHAAVLRGENLDADRRSLVDVDDREMLRGENQESEHNKKRTDD